MPAYVQRYRCPDCGQGFRWPARQPPPDFCPACGAYVAEDAAPASPMAAPKAPAIHTKPHSLDKVYRAMEEGSEHRAQVAAEMTGASAAEMSALKLTDMKDRPHEGESSVVMRPNPVSTFMQNVPSGAVGMVGSAGAEYARAAHTGPYPHAGEQARQMVTGRHGALAASAQRRGQIN